jgi:hypothetical protein
LGCFFLAHSGTVVAVGVKRFLLGVSGSSLQKIVNIPQGVKKILQSADVWRIAKNVTEKNNRRDGVGNRPKRQRE